MGEAKRRGSQQDRVAQAEAKINGLRPDAIVCNSCQSKLTDVKDWAGPAKQIPGLDAVFYADCEPCKSKTFALKGTPEAVEEFAAAMQMIHEEDAQFGVQGKNVL